MIAYLNIALAIVPAIFLVWYYYKKDVNRPEPKSLIIRTFVIGIISIIPTMAIGYPVMLYFQDVFQENFLALILTEAFITAALIEETIKFLALRFFIFNHPKYDEITDGIIYAITLSLGFACLENILYSTETEDISIPLLRAFTAVPGHAIWSGIMGYYMGKAKMGDSQKRTGFFLKGLLFAVLLHGLYDVAAFSQNELVIFLGIPGVLIVGFFILRHFIKKAVSEDRNTMMAQKMDGP